jgi:enoyl-CoA hydratase
LRCDIVVAAKNARFGHPEITLGILSGARGPKGLRAPLAKAVDLVLTGRLIEATEVERIGRRVVPSGTAFTAALEIAQELAKRPPLALRFAK